MTIRWVTTVDRNGNEVLQKLVVKAAGLSSITRYQTILKSLNGT